MISPTRKNGRVLIIDDELGPRESLRILLKKHYDVVCADSVQRGLELLQQQHPDVIVSDIRMPGVNGIEGLRMIREIDASVPVIMLTGYGALETAQEAIRHGASDYMKKPFDAHEMLSVIRRNVERCELTRRREENLKSLEDMNARLLDEISSKSRLAAMGQASAELVHDLRNPMMIVLGYIQMLAQDLNANAAVSAGDSKETTEYMEVIEKNIRRCKDIIDSWLDLSRNNQMTLKPIDIVEAVRETVDHIRPLAREKGAEVACEAPATTIPVLGHGTQIKRALNNLMGNAVDALSGQGGCVTVQVKLEDNHVDILITDNGEGIHEDHLPHIFKPFYSSKSPGQGTGLGLFITRKIIEDHHGSIVIDSTEGQGTRVTIRLPALQEAEQPA